MVSKLESIENLTQLRALLRSLSQFQQHNPTMNLPVYADSTIEKSSLEKLHGCAEKFIDQLFSQIDVIEWDGYEDQGTKKQPDAQNLMILMLQQQQQLLFQMTKEQKEERKEQKEERREREERNQRREEQTLQMFQTMMQQQNHNNGRSQPSAIDKQGPPVASFSGEGSKGQKKDFSQWIPQYEECARVFQYNDEMKLFWLKQKLTGNAQSFMGSQAEDIRTNYIQSSRRITQQLF